MFYLMVTRVGLLSYGAFVEQNNMFQYLMEKLFAVQSIGFGFTKMP